MGTLPEVPYLKRQPLFPSITSTGVKVMGTLNYAPLYNATVTEGTLPSRGSGSTPRNRPAARASTSWK